MRLTDKQKAARKGARTKAANQASHDRFQKIDRPVLNMIDELINNHLASVRVNVEFVDRGGTGIKLKHGITHGQLVKVESGGKIWKVWPLGYKRPQSYHAGFWSLGEAA